MDTNEKEVVAGARFICKPDADDPDWGATAWWDIEREKVVLVRAGKDPNTYIRHQQMRLLFTDQAEYYIVCASCHSTYADMQWSGSTRNRNWRTESAEYLEEHTRTKGWCEFCDPVFGNGGWLR